MRSQNGSRFWKLTLIKNVLFCSSIREEKRQQRYSVKIKHLKIGVVIRFKKIYIYLL